MTKLEHKLGEHCLLKDQSIASLLGGDKRMHGRQRE